MAITTIDGVIAGARPPEPIMKVGIAMSAIGQAHSHLYSPGAPGAAVAPTPGVNGAALTTYAGQIPFTNPAGGLFSYLTRLSLSASSPCTILLCDRLWHNSGLSVTLTTSQAITSPAWPARDIDGATLGEGVLIGIEHSTTGGAASGTLTLTYTNQAGTGSRTATLTPRTTPPIGTFERFGLMAGDTGVRSVQSYQASATRTSGAFHLVAYRVIASVNLSAANVGQAIDALTSGFPRLYDNTVPFLVQIPSATTATTLAGEMSVSQG